MAKDRSFIVISGIHFFDEDFGPLGDVGDRLVPDPFLLTVCDPDDPPENRKMVFVSRRDVEVRIDQLRTVMAKLSPDLWNSPAGIGLYEVWQKYWQPSFFGPDWDEDLYEFLVTGIAETILLHGSGIDQITGLLLTFALNRKMTPEEYQRVISDPSP